MPTRTENECGILKCSNTTNSARSKRRGKKWQAKGAMSSANNAQEDESEEKKPLSREANKPTMRKKKPKKKTELVRKKASALEMRNGRKKESEQEKRKRQVLMQKRQEEVAKRVEEEAVKKLIRAEVMFSLLKEHKQATATSSLTHTEESATTNMQLPYGFNPGNISADELRTKVGTWEKQLQGCLGNTRTTNTVDRDDCDRSIKCLRTAIRDTYFELLVNHCSCASMGFSKMLWANWYTEIDEQQSIFRKLSRSSPTNCSSNNPIEEKDNSSCVRDVLTTILASCTEFYKRLLHELLDKHKQKLINTVEGSNPGDLSKIYNAITHFTLVVLGDLARYTQGVVVNRKSRNYDVAVNFYRRALSIFPSNGKVYNQLALIAFLENNVFEGIYMYVRSLTTSNPFTSRESLMQVLSRFQESSAKSTSPNSLKGNRKLDIKDQFIEKFASCISICFTNVEVESFPVELENAVNLLKNLMNGCYSIIFSQVNAYMSCNHTQPPLGKIYDHVDQMSNFLMKCMALSIFSVHNSQMIVRNNRESPYCFDDEVPNWENSACVRHSLSLSFNLCSILLQLCIPIAASKNMQVQQIQTNLEMLMMCLPAINLLLDWLRLHPWFLTISDIDCFLDFQKILLTFLQTLPKIANNDALLNIDTSFFYYINSWSYYDEQLQSFPKLPEDIELDGFLPYQSILANRFKDFRKSGKNGPIVTLSSHHIQQPDKDELSICQLILRTRIVRVCTFGNFLFDELGWQMCVLSSENDDQATAEQICPQCSNSCEFIEQTCEFCGFIVPHEGNELEDDTKANRGMLHVEKLNQLKLQNKSTDYTRSRGSRKKNSRHYPRTKIEINFGPAQALALKNADQPKYLVVLDAPNIAMRHGKNKFFSSRGIEIAFEYYMSRGHEVMAFLPDYLLEYESVGAKKRLKSAGWEVPASKIPDDVCMLAKMEEKGWLFSTPSSDYDDSYCIQYASKHDGCLVTNDLYRDHVKDMEGTKEAKNKVRHWLRARRISFTFVKDEFFPNPDFSFNPIVIE